MKVQKNHLLIVILVFGFLIRLVALNQSLWLDEAVTAKVVQLNWTEIFTKFLPGDFHPPLYYLLTKLWISQFGALEISLRLPSVIYSVITGFIVYKIATLIYKRNVGLLAATLFMVNPLGVYYAQEARMYLLATLFLAGATYFCLKLIYKPEVKTTFKIHNEVWLGIFTALAFNTFYGSVFYTLTLWILLLLKKKHRQNLISVAVFGFGVLPVMPLLFMQIGNSRSALANVVNWKLVLGTVNLKNLALFPLKFLVGRVSFLPKYFYWGLSLVWVVLCTAPILINSRQRKILIALTLLPIILGVLFSVFSPLLQYFRFIYLLIPLSILLAIAIDGFKKYRQIIILTIVGGFIFWSGLYLFLQQFHREDWRSLVRSIPLQSEQRLYESIEMKLSIFMVTSASDPIQYYDRNLKINDLSVTDFRDVSDQYIVVIPYVTDVHGIDYKSKLLMGGFKKVKEEVFRGLSFQIWEKT